MFSGVSVCVPRTSVINLFCNALKDAMIKVRAAGRLASSADNGPALVNEYRARVDDAKRRRIGAAHRSLSLRHGTARTAILIEG